MARHREAEALGFVESHRARLLAEKIGTRNPTADFRRFRTAPRRVSSPTGWRRGARTVGGDSDRREGIRLAGDTEIRGWSTAIRKPSGTAPIGARPAVSSTTCSSLRRRLYCRTGTHRAPRGAARGPRADLGVRPTIAVVPDGCLHGLNFETLIAPAGLLHRGCHHRDCPVAETARRGAWPRRAESIDPPDRRPAASDPASHRCPSPRKRSPGSPPTIAMPRCSPARRRAPKPTPRPSPRASP